MCMGGGSTPSPPPPPRPPQPVQRPAIPEALKRPRRGGAFQVGAPGSTLLTGPQGVGTPAIGRSLLGGTTTTG